MMDINRDLAQVMLQRCGGRCESHKCRGAGLGRCTAPVHYGDVIESADYFERRGEDVLDPVNWLVLCPACLNTLRANNDRAVVPAVSG